MTTILSKGISTGLEIEQFLRQKADLLKNQMQTELRDRGLKLSVEDLALLVEEVSPVGAQSILNFAVGLLRSFPAGMGLRVVKLSDTQVELVLPNKIKNLRFKEGPFHEGALVTAALEAWSLLWSRHEPFNFVESSIVEIRFQQYRKIQNEIRVRCEFPELQRETLLAKLRQNQQGSLLISASLFEGTDQRVGEIEMQMKFISEPALCTPKEPSYGDT